MESIADHWLLATYVSTMLFNENAILAAFSLSVGAGGERYFMIALAAGLGTLTNDLILYMIARFGLLRFFKQEDGAREEPPTFFQRMLFRNILLSIILLKFFFGMRTFLTLYLVAKTRIAFLAYLFYSLCAVALYIAVLALLGWCIGIGMGGVFETYDTIMKGMLIVVTVLVLTHLVSFLLRRRASVRKQQ